MKNFEDRISAWGYMTVCNTCEFEGLHGKKCVPLQVDLTKEVTGFPCIECEICGNFSWIAHGGEDIK